MATGGGPNGSVTARSSYYTLTGQIPGAGQFCLALQYPEPPMTMEEGRSAMAAHASAKLGASGPNILLNLDEDVRRHDL
jgi:hypothetical protein